MKRCNTCGKLLPFSAFSNNRALRDGLAQECRACKKIRRSDLTLPRGLWISQHNRGSMAPPFTDHEARISAEDIRFKYEKAIVDGFMREGWYPKTDECVNCVNMVVGYALLARDIEELRKDARKVVAA